MTFSAVAASASATTIEFATYYQPSSNNQWTIASSGGTTTVTAAGAVDFIFLIPGTPFGNTAIPTTFSLTASSTQAGECSVACGPGDSLTQYGYTGTFSFIENGGPDPGANLLSGTFALVTGTSSSTGAQFQSSVGGSGANFDASATAGNLSQLVLTSSFLNFNNQTEEDSGFTLSALSPNFAVGPVSPGDTAYPNPAPAANFVASGAGTFSSDPGPTVAASTPEPATFCLIGGGLVGLGIIRRRKLLSA